MKAFRLFILLVFVSLLLCSCQQSPPDKVNVISASATDAVSPIVETNTAPVSRTVKSAPDKKSTATEYVLNLNTKKFHKPKCSSVKQMKESNKKYVTKTREEIIADGYSPCGRCNP